MGREPRFIEVELKMPVSLTNGIAEWPVTLREHAEALRESRDRLRARVEEPTREGLEDDACVNARTLYTRYKDHIAWNGPDLATALLVRRALEDTKALLTAGGKPHQAVSSRLAEFIG